VTDLLARYGELAYAWHMLVGQISFALIGALCLFIALRPEVSTRYFLAEYQRRSIDGNYKAVSYTGWVMFGFCVLVVMAMSFQDGLRPHAPMLESLGFLTFAVAYIWWGVTLVRKPDSIIRRTSEPWNRLPVWAVRGFGLLLILAAVGFLYAFATRIKHLL